MQSTIHERAVVHVLADVPEVLQHQYGMFDLLGTFDYSPRNTVGDVVDELSQTVAILLSDSLTLAPLEAMSGGEVRLAEEPHFCGFVAVDVGNGRVPRSSR